MSRRKNEKATSMKITKSVFVGAMILAISIYCDQDSITHAQTPQAQKQDPTQTTDSESRLFPAKYGAVIDAEQKRKFAYQRFFTSDKFNRRITFYLSRLRVDPKKPLPLIVCIQGSGSQSIFSEIETATGKLIGSGGPEAVIGRTFRDQVRLLVVEKPGVEFLVQPQRPGSAEESSATFRREHTLGRWTEAINAAILSVLNRKDIEPSKVLVLGHSEGGQVACQVAAINPKVTHVASMAGGGPTQLFDFLQMARSGTMYDPNSTAQERVNAFLSDWKRVQDDPLATDKFILGHPHRRWSTFSSSSPVEAILKSNAKVFIAQGTDDTNSLPASAEVLYAELLARNRDVTFLRVEGGNHGFMSKNDRSGKGWSETNGKAVEWFLNLKHGAAKDAPSTAIK